MRPRAHRTASPVTLAASDDETLASVIEGLVAAGDPAAIRAKANAAALVKQLRTQWEVGRQEAEVLQRMLAKGSREQVHEYLRAHPPSPECIVLLLEENKRLGVSEQNARSARAKNERQRAEVCTAWMSRTDYGQSKSSFGVQWSNLLKTRDKLSITSRTIANNWLKGLP